MTKSEMDLWDSSLFGPALLVINQYFDCCCNEYLVLWLCLVSSVTLSQQLLVFLFFLNLLTSTRDSGNGNDFGLLIVSKYATVSL